MKILKIIAHIIIPILLSIFTFFGLWTVLGMINLILQNSNPKLIITLGNLLMPICLFVLIISGIISTTLYLKWNSNKDQQDHE